MAQIYRVSIHAHVWVSLTLDAALKVAAFASRWGKLMLSNRNVEEGVYRGHAESCSGSLEAGCVE
jgi:hypothetical protein